MLDKSFIEYYFFLEHKNYIIKDIEVRPLFNNGKYNKNVSRIYVRYKTPGVFDEHTHSFLIEEAHDKIRLNRVNKIKSLLKKQ